MMSLPIVAAKNMNHALDILSIKPRKAIRNCIVEEPEGMDCFLYDFKEHFLNYDVYYIRIEIHILKMTKFMK